MMRLFSTGVAVMALLSGAQRANAQLSVTVDGDAWIDAVWSGGPKTSEDFGDEERAIAAPVIGQRAAGDKVGQRQFGLSQLARFNVVAKWDVGYMTYGARYRLLLGDDGGNSVTNDKAFIFFNSTIGDINLGLHSGPIDNIVVEATEWGQGGINGFLNDYIPGIQPGEFLSADYVAYVSANPNYRLNYYTPRFDTIRGSFSYVPYDQPFLPGGRRYNLNSVIIADAPTQDQAIPSGASPGWQFASTSSFFDVFEFTVDYESTISEINLRLYASYIFGRTQSIKYGDLEKIRYNDLSTYSFGGRVDYGALAMSFHYTNGGQSGYRKTNASTGPAIALADTLSWSVNLQYTIGPVIMGGQYAHQAAPVGLGGSNLDAGQLFSPTGQIVANSTFDYVAIGASWEIAPGVALQPEIGHYSQNTIIRPVSGISGRVDGELFILRTQIFF